MKKLPSALPALYQRVISGQEDALDALLANPDVEFHTHLKVVSSVFSAVALCRDIPTQRRMLQRLSGRWPADHEAWQHHWALSVESDIYHFEWYVQHGCKPNTLTIENRSLLQQLVLSSYKRTTKDSQKDGLELFDHLRSTIPVCGTPFDLLLAWQGAVRGVHVEAMEKLLSVGGIDPNRLMVGKALGNPEELIKNPVGQDVVTAIIEHRSSYGGIDSQKRYEAAFHLLHEYGLDWDVEPNGTPRKDALYSSYASVKNDPFLEGWYDRLRADQRSVVLKNTLPSPSPSRRSPRF